ncbi:MAG: hypothetical protein QXN23_05940 [Candidatus Caldarchaeum sp.]
MSNIYYTQPTTVTVNWGTTGDKTLLSITDNLPAGNKVVLFALGWESNVQVPALGYLKIMRGSLNLVQEGITRYFNTGGAREKAVMFFAYDANAPANAQYTFIATVTTAASGSTTLHVQGMVILLDGSAFFTTGSNTNIAAGATVNLATVNTNFPAGSKVAILAYVQMGSTSSSTGAVLYDAGNIRIVENTAVVSSTQFRAGTWSNTDPAVGNLSYLSTSTPASPSYSIQVYNSLTVASQAWGEIIAFRVGDGAFLDTASVGLTNGSQVTVGSLSTSLSGEVGVIALAAAETTTAGIIFSTDDVVLQLNNNTTGQVSNKREWLMELYSGRGSGIYPLFRADTDVSSPSYQVKMTARASGLNGEAKILVFSLVGLDIKKVFGEVLDLLDAALLSRQRFRPSSETVNLSEGRVSGRSMFRFGIDILDIIESGVLARFFVKRFAELLNLLEQGFSIRSRFRVAGETLQFSETFSRLSGRFRSFIEFVNVSEVLRRAQNFFRLHGEQVNLVESSSIFRVMSKVFSEFVDILEGVRSVVAHAIIRVVGEFVRLSELFSRLRQLFRGAVETLSISDFTSKALALRRPFGEVLNVSEAVPRIRGMFRMLLETVRLPELFSRFRSSIYVFLENINLIDAVLRFRRLSRTFVSAINVSETLSLMRAFVKVVAETLSVAWAVSVRRALARILAEVVRAVEGSSVSRTLASIVYELIGISEGLLRILGKAFVVAEQIFVGEFVKFRFLIKRLASKLLGMARGKLSGVASGGVE